ncbi:cysteine desulfurase [Candidatus Woesearchaeota archaeon]|nr:cysteine desulfurase [Candidatus Woesearchaeota archaeon]
MNSAHFPLLEKNKSLVYLDSGATSQKPAVVIKAMNDFYLNYNANVHRGIYTISEEATIAYEKAHEVVAKFIGAELEEIIFTRGTTESLNFLAVALGKKLKVGDEIVLSEMEHHSNIVPWQQIAKVTGAVLKYIPITSDYRLNMSEAKKIITNKTKIVSIVHMSNVLGTINPVKELAQMAHKVGAVIIVDAAQSVPHLKINVKDLDSDFLVFSGHKMCGPTGIGVLYGKKELLQKMEPFQFGGGMIQEVTFEHSTWTELPWKFEAGTPMIAEAIGLMAAVEYLQSIGMENIEKHTSDLTQYALGKLSAIPELTIVGPTETKDRGAVISFTLNEIHPHDVGEVLNRKGIAVRVGHHCTMPLHKLLKLNGTVRSSFYLYNTKEDVDKLVRGILETKKIFRAEKITKK